MTQLGRRDFLKVSALMAVGAALASCVPDSPQTSETPPAPTPTSLATLFPPPEEDAFLAHTLRRVTWGLTPELVQRALQLGVDGFLKEQLSPETIDDSEVDSFLSRFETLTMTPTERNELENYAQPPNELIGATLFRQWKSARQLYEVMVDFWSNHFNIYIRKNQCRILKTDDDLNVIRPNALGHFDALLSASAHSPAMLVYLDQAASSKDAINENYARELMELHTISVNGGYSHEDIVNVARAFSGWSVATQRDAVFAEPGTFLFRKRRHDTGAKKILALEIPAGGGEEDGQRVLEMLASHPMTAYFISFKLARRFVSDTPPDTLVESLSQVFLETGGDIRKMLWELFHSEEFKASRGQKFKRPLEFILSALRVTDARLQGRVRGVLAPLRRMGQIPFLWVPPTGYPDEMADWANTSGFLERWNFAFSLVSGNISGVSVDLRALTAEAESPEDVVDVLSIRFLGERLPDDARAILVDVASEGDLGKNLPNIAGLLLASPHFQVR